MTILVEKLAGYRRITLNRPERLNALTVEMAAALSAALDDAVADKTCRAILLTGAGRGFCAGQDLTEIIGASPADLDRLLAHYHPLILKIRALPIPVVCAVNGVAAGAGANLALACDILFASTEASFIQSFTKIGVIPDSGGTFLLPRIVGLHRANVLTMLAEKISAQQALEWGMVYKVCEPAALLDTALATAKQLATQPTRALGLTKRGFNKSLGVDL